MKQTFLLPSLAQPFTMGLRQPPAKKLPFVPKKRSVVEMLGSPDREAPMTPTPFGSVTPNQRPGSVASSQRPRAIRPYRSPSVEEEVEEPELPGSSSAALKLKEKRRVLGWKLPIRCLVPKSARVLRAGARACCVKCSHTYFNFPDQMCWLPEGLEKCADCLKGNHRCRPVRTLPSLP